MKKLKFYRAYDYWAQEGDVSNITITTDGVVDATVRKVDQLIDLVNSQQEAIEKLEEHVDHEARHVSEPADDTQLIAGYTIEELEKIADTHRTVTLRIPKGMTVGRTILEAMGSSQSSVLSKSDTDLQKALDEVKGESNE